MHAYQNMLWYALGGRYYSCDHSSDYIGSEKTLTGDGVIYPKYTPFSGAEAGNSTSQLYEPSYRYMYIQYCSVSYM
jgi:hypothetical protein